jgi:hypothetical protein
MRNLADIIEDCKTNKRPDYDELRYSVLVLTFILNSDHRALREELLREKETPKFLREMKAQNSFEMYHTALNKSPKEYLGWNNDPENPEYQRFHTIGTKLVDKALRGELPNQKKQR